MIEGSALIPAIWIAITNALEAAVPVPVTRSGLFEGTIMLMICLKGVKDSIPGLGNRRLTKEPRLIITGG